MVSVLNLACKQVSASIEREQVMCVTQLNPHFDSKYFRKSVRCDLGKGEKISNAIKYSGTVKQRSIAVKFVLKLIPSCNLTTAKL